MLAKLNFSEGAGYAAGLLWTLGRCGYNVEFINAEQRPYTVTISFPMAALRRRPISTWLGEAQKTPFVQLFVEESDITDEK